MLNVTVPDYWQDFVDLNVLIGENSVEIVQRMTPIERAQAVRDESFVNLNCAIDENRAGCTHSILAAYQASFDADWNCSSTAVEMRARLLDHLEFNYKTLPLAVRAAYDACLMDIDRAGMTEAERDVVQANREARGLR